MALLCAPIFLGSVAWGFYLIAQKAGLVVFVICCISAIVTALGIALQLDSLEQKQNRQPGAR